MRSLPDASVTEICDQPESLDLRSCLDFAARLVELCSLSPGLA